MTGNMLVMGLTLRSRTAITALSNVRFLALSLLWCFVLSPALAWLFTKTLPMAQPYAIGMLFLGLAPCAPFLPRVVEKAHGDTAYVAAFILLASVGTVICMPLLVPVLVDGFNADTWSIAKPLVLFVAAPVAVGVVVQRAMSHIAEAVQPVVKKATAVATVLMLVLVVLIYGRDFLSAIGTYAIAAQILYCALVTVGSYTLGFGLVRSERSVLALGVGTRNIGAAIAPLFAAGNTDRRAIAMCALAVPITVISSLVAAKYFARLAEAGDLPRAHTGDPAPSCTEDFRKEA